MADKRILVCGGCGFIGSNFVHHLHARYPHAEITVLDALTYAGSLENLEPLYSEKRIIFVKADIGLRTELEQYFDISFDLAANFAAESHVDRSLYYSTRFVRSNILGTENLLSLCRESNCPFLQISTDEVYGPAPEDVRYAETAPLNPTSPYAASKAAADLIVLAAIKTFKQNAVIVRTCNNYGPRQFPEKLIPYFIYLIQKDEQLPLYGDGLQLRNWLHVDDFCEALLRIVDNFPPGEVYNIGGEQEQTNLEVTKMVVEMFGKGEIKHVEDRPAHDRRYSLNSAKFEAQFGKIASRDFVLGLQQTIDWYRSHPEIFERIECDDPRRFRAQHYQKQE